ncbi:MAG: FAD:protein FMN transferase [Akkermansiaceae bacterium]|jgi:thiamine biosynthesis lipoprotein
MIRLFLLFPILLLAACRSEDDSSSDAEVVLTRIETQRPLMGTLFRIITYAEDDEAGHAAMEEALDLAENFADRATDYDRRSELNQLTDTRVGEAVKVSPELYEVIALGVKLAKETEGVFDPTLGPLTHLWRAMLRTGAKPDEEELAAARERCGVEFLKLDDEAQTITVLQEGMQLDLGGIAKGFAADLIFDQLKSEGYAVTLVAVAGDLRMGDAPPDKEGWTVGLRTFNLTPVKTIELSNCAVSTSGDLFQKVEVGGETFSHLIDPRTGLGLTVRRAASVILPEAKLTDPLATAACLADDPKQLFEDWEGMSLRVLYENAEIPPVVTGKFQE